MQQLFRLNKSPIKSKKSTLRTKQSAESRYSFITRNHSSHIRLWSKCISIMTKRRVKVNVLGRCPGKVPNSIKYHELSKVPSKIPQSYFFWRAIVFQPTVWSKICVRLNIFSAFENFKPFDTKGFMTICDIFNHFPCIFFLALCWKGDLNIKIYVPFIVKAVSLFSRGMIWLPSG